MAGEVRRRLDAILDATFAAFPSQGRDLGLHAYDGLVDDLSPTAPAGRAGQRVSTTSATSTATASATQNSGSIP
jgi:hypothetical protein